MKWGRKKKKNKGTPSSSPARSTSSSHVFPMSWLSKFKQNCGNFGSESREGKQKGKWDAQSRTLPQQQQDSCGEGRFYAGDNDAFWRLSFGNDRVRGSEIGGDGLRSVWYDSDDEPEPPFPSFPGSRSAVTRGGPHEESKIFSDSVSDIRKMRKLSLDFDSSASFAALNENKEGEAAESRLAQRKSRVRKDTTPDVQSQKDGKEVELTKAAKDVLKLDFANHQGLSTLKNHSDLRRIEEDNPIAGSSGDQVVVPAEDVSQGWQKLKEVKIKAVTSRSEKERKSLYSSGGVQRRRAKQSSKVRVYSPRTASKVESCKIKALEDMKKAKLKAKKKRKEAAAEEGKEPESFAVVKCSFDPQKDFRDSMVEMITEKRITSSVELEELLACYLTLNCDEYHDLIIKVFRQVWFDLNQQAADLEIQAEHCCCNN